MGGSIGPLAGAGLAAGVGFRATFVVRSLVLLATAFVVLWAACRSGETEIPGTLAAT